MGDRKSREPSKKIFVGNLTADVTEKQLEEAFAKHGQLRMAWVARNPAGFGFVEFEDEQDAKEACKELDGATVAGCIIKTEIAHGGKPRPGRGGHNSFSGSDRGRGPPRDGGFGKDRDSGRFYGGRSGRGYSPERRQRSPPRSDTYFQDQEMRRLREENAKLRMEVDDLRAIINGMGSMSSHSSKYSHY